MSQTIAQQIEAESYDEDGYSRPSPAGKLIWSSNWHSGTSGWSFSPTEIYEFEDGSKLEVGYSGCWAL